MKITDLYESRKYHLYHALQFSQASQALRENKQGGYSNMRWWSDGKRYTYADPREIYDNSNFHIGISMTRDINFAKEWDEVIFFFDYDQLKRDYKIIPVNDFYASGGFRPDKDHKREKEEFIVTKTFVRGETPPDYDPETDTLDDLWMNIYRSMPHGYVEPLDKYLTNIKFSKKFMGSVIDFEKDDMEYIRSHSLFSGYV